MRDVLWVTNSITSYTFDKSVWDDVAGQNSISYTVSKVYESCSDPQNSITSHCDVMMLLTHWTSLVHFCYTVWCDAVTDPQNIISYTFVTKVYDVMPLLTHWTASHRTLCDKSVREMFCGSLTASLVHSVTKVYERCSVGHQQHHIVHSVTKVCERCSVGQ